MNCIYCRFGECTKDIPDDEYTGDCDTCPYGKEVDEFAQYVEWIKGEDAKLRKGEVEHDY